MIAGIAGILSVLAGPTLVQDTTPREQVVSGAGAVLRGLDKVSGQTVDIELPTGEPLVFEFENGEKLRHYYLSEQETARDVAE